MLRGDITMNFNQEEMKGEADKAINIHAMMMGRQIMLCKKKNMSLWQNGCNSFKMPINT